MISKSKLRNVIMNEFTFVVAERHSKKSVLSYDFNST